MPSRLLTSTLLVLSNPKRAVQVAAWPSMARLLAWHAGKWQAQPSSRGWMAPRGEPAQAPSGSQGHVACLFAMPCESNFSGERYDPSIVASLQQSGPWGSSPLASESPLEGLPAGSCHTASCSQPSHPGGLRTSAQSPGPVDHHDPVELPHSSSPPAQPTQPSHVPLARKGPDSQDVDLKRLGQHLVAASSCPLQPCVDPLRRLLSKGRRCGFDAPAGLESHAVQQQWYVLLDAAKACASSPPNLSTCPADFVVRAILPCP